MSQPAAAAASVPELLLLGCEGAGKSCLCRRIKRAAHTAMQGSAAAVQDEVSFASAPTNGVEREELSWRRAPFIVKEFVFDVSNPFQFADSLFELASLMHNPQIAATPMLVVLSKIDAVGALSRAELQSSLRLDDVLSSARGGAQTPSMPPPVVLECSAVEGTGIEELLDEMATLAKASHK